MTKPRIRSLALPLGLAVLAAVLIGVYVVSYRHSVTHSAGMVKVLVASRDIPAGTAGRQSPAAAISRRKRCLGGLWFRARSRVPAPLTSLVTAARSTRASRSRFASSSHLPRAASSQSSPATCAR